MVRVPAGYWVTPASLPDVPPEAAGVLPQPQTLMLIRPASKALITTFLFFMAFKTS